MAFTARVATSFHHILNWKSGKEEESAGSKGSYFTDIKNPEFGKSSGCNSSNAVRQSEIIYILLGF
jgi:hypothetical protein